MRYDRNHMIHAIDPHLIANSALVQVKHLRFHLQSAFISFHFKADLQQIDAFCKISFCRTFNGRQNDCFEHPSQRFFHEYALSHYFL